MADISKIAHAKYYMIHGNVQGNFKRIQTSLRTKLSSASPRYASFVIADSLFGLTKQDWDGENDMWKLKEFEDLYMFLRY